MFIQWDKFLSKHFQGKTESEIIKELKEAQNSPEFATFLNKFMQYLNTESKIAPSSCRIYFNYLKSWLRANAIRINSDDIKQFVQQPKIIKEARFPMTVQHVRLICDHSSKTMRTFLVTLLSSGMRMGECLQLRVMDVDLDNCTVRLRADTTKGREERVAFISVEAKDMILQLIKKKKKNPEDTIFTDSFTKYTKINFEARFADARNKAKLDWKYDLTSNRYKVNIHGIRAIFNTVATKEVGGDIAHAMIGHHGYLDQYLRMDFAERKKLYKKIEPNVSLSSENILKEELETTKKEVRSQDYFDKELAKRDDEIRKMKDVMESMMKN